MATLKILLICIPVIIILKLATKLFMKIYNFNDEKLKFTMEVKADRINQMSNLEFEGFCKWLFEGTNKFNDIHQTSKENDGVVDLILTTESNNKIYVECKRQISEDKDFIIGTDICQKLVGAMVANNIKKGIIITTGYIHQSAFDYVSSLKKVSELSIEFFTMKDIVTMLQSREEYEDYSMIVEI